MKKTLFFLLLAWTFSLLTANAETFISTKPGSLAKQYKDKTATTNELKVVGLIDGKDLATIWEMIHLKVLDLSEFEYKPSKCIIKEGDGSKKDITPMVSPFDNSIRDFPLNPRSSLETLVLPKSIITLKTEITIKDLYTFTSFSISNKDIVCQNIHIMDEKFKNIGNINVFEREHFFHYIGFEGITYKYGSGSPFFYKRDNNIETLYIKDRSLLGSDFCGQLNPLFVVIENEGKVALANGGFFSGEVNLEGIDEIFPLALAENTEITSVIWPSTISALPDYCFWGCSKLQKITLENVQSIGIKAFSGCPLTQVDYLSSSPAILNSEEDFKYAVISIPAGSRQNFGIGPWKNFRYRVEGEKRVYDFETVTPGNLSTILPQEAYEAAEQISLKGIIFDTDFDCLLRCKNLVVLDLSECLIIKSPETLQKELDEKKALAGLMSAFTEYAVNETQKERRRGNASQYDVKLAKAGNAVFSEAEKELEKATIQIDSTCIMPECLMAHLTKLILPNKLERLSNKCRANEVVLPESLKEIGNYVFYDVTKLIIPSSVTKIGEKAFYGSSRTIEMLDMSKMSLEELPSDFLDHPEKLTKFATPKGLKRYPAIFHIPNAVCYFYTKEEPAYFYVSEAKEVHIPQGCKAGWASLISDSKNRNFMVIDDL